MRIRSTGLIVPYVIAVVLLAACRSKAPIEPSEKPPLDAAASPLTATDPGALPATLEQGWEDSTREAFWFTPQGAHVLPYEWFLNLERPDSAELLRSAVNMERYRYVAMPKSAMNPDGLPLGFTRDVDIESGAVFVGLTCAACHTSKLRLGGREVLIDGGPTLADFKTFLHDMNQALLTTQNESAKFDRFAARVMGSTATREGLDKLRADLKARTDVLVTRETNDRTVQPYGFARLDAFGAIVNNVATAALGVPENAAPPDAPVSYPFIWDTPRTDRVQWNGAALNTPIVGPLIRNVGEVLGVFGRLEIRPKHALDLAKGYPNSVNLANLGKLENWLKDLQSPAWPSKFLPAIDTARAVRGADIYAKACASCHESYDSRKPERSFRAVMTPVKDVGTDPSMARNYLERRGQTAGLEGTPLMIVAGPNFAREARTFEIVINGVTGVILNHPLQALRIGILDLNRNHALRIASLSPVSDEPKDDSVAMLTLKGLLQRYIAQAQPFDATTFSYKARPLNGIWATAPYLHNGSVPNLWELLQPPAQRVAKFYVGSRDFDAQRVGLASDSPDGNWEFDVAQHGNANAGHEYGTLLVDEDKWALIEYLKTL